MPKLKAEPGTIIVKAKVRPGVFSAERFVTFTGAEGEEVHATLQGHLCDEDAQTVSVRNLGMHAGNVFVQTWDDSGYWPQCIILPVSSIVDWGM